MVTLWVSLSNSNLQWKVKKGRPIIAVVIRKEISQRRRKSLLKLFQHARNLNILILTFNLESLTYPSTRMDFNQERILFLLEMGDYIALILVFDQIGETGLSWKS